MSPKAGSEVSKTSRSATAPNTPILGRGISEGEDILFFENSPPPPPAPSALGLSAAKLAALRKLKAKGAGLEKEDPNAVKRKRSNSSEINNRVEKNLASPNGKSIHASLFFKSTWLQFRLEKNSVHLILASVIGSVSFGILHLLQQILNIISWLGVCLLCR